MEIHTNRTYLKLPVPSNHHFFRSLETIGDLAMLVHVESIDAIPSLSSFPIYIQDGMGMTSKTIKTSKTIQNLITNM